MDMIYWTFKGIEVIFYLAVIVYVIGRWKK